MKNTGKDNTAKARGEGQPENEAQAPEAVQLDDDLQIEIERNESSEQDVVQRSRREKHDRQL